MMDSAHLPHDLRDQFIAKSDELSHWLHKHAATCKIRDKPKCRLASRAFFAALDHHRSIVFLASHDYWASASALVRVMFEAYVRGLWIRFGAASLDLHAFVTTDMFEKSCGSMIKEIEERREIEASWLTEIKREAWSGMCDYVHTGMVLLSRYDTDTPKSDFTNNDGVGLLKDANRVAILVGYGLMYVADSLNQLDTLHQTMQAYLDQFEAIT